MNKITQEAQKRQAIVKLAVRKGKSFAARIYGVSLSSVKRWTARYDGTWQSLREKSHRPHSHPARHSSQEEAIISAGMDEAFFRYGWEGAYMAAKKRGYTRSYNGFIYATKRMGFAGGSKNKKKTRVHNRRYWSNHKIMRTLGNKSPIEFLREKLAVT